jgi:alpha-tubulin suppressor-like RCC1 family protein
VFVHQACAFGCSPTPVQVSGLGAVVAISAGGTHSCALRADGTAWCWGDNRDGALQHHACHDGDCASTPVHVSGLTGVASISAGYLSSCALGADGTAWCWGDNRSRQLGDGVFLHGYFPGTWTDCSLTPVQVKL